MDISRAIKVIGSASAFLFAVVSTPPAFAWTWVYKVTVYNASGLCVQGDSGIDHLQPNVFSGNLAYDATYARQGCSGPGMNLPAGWAAARLDVYKWTGSTWAVCRGSNWQFGPTGNDQFGPTGPGQVFDYGGPASCGPGFYGTLAFAYVWDGSAWRGGGVWSGFELVQ